MKQETTSLEAFRDKLYELTEHINVEDGDALIVIASKQKNSILGILGTDYSNITVELGIAMKQTKSFAIAMQMAVKAHEELEREERQTNNQQNNGK